VKSLLDEQAIRANILHEFEQLRDRCEKSGVSNPLVIVYFSGHGWVDDRNRHYLVSYDTRRDNLRGTALSNNDVKQALDDLNTTRLIVFLDACHSGGMGQAGIKGGLSQFDYKALGAGEGRYLIASCKQDQQSFERKDNSNSIFTYHLLQLLRCESDDFDDCEEVDIFHLFPKLREKVVDTARDIGKTQEPTITNANQATGLIVAINERARKLRIEKEHKKNKDEYAKLIFVELTELQEREKTSKKSATSKCPHPVILRTWLRGYVEKGETTKGSAEFYACFEEYRDLWNKGRPHIPECLEALITYQEEALLTPRPQNASGSQEQPQASDTFANAQENKLLEVEKAVARAPVPPSGPQQLKRQLSDEDRAYIFAEIAHNRAYGPDVSTLETQLTRPLTEAEFDSTVGDIALRADEAFKLNLQEVKRRFRERWPLAKTVEVTMASVLMMARR
jgi:hypothetical protein